MSNFPFLSVLTFLPLLGVLALLLLRGSADCVARISRLIALLVSGATFVFSLLVLRQFDASSADFQMIESYPVIPGIGMTFKLGVDSIAMALIMLTTFLTPLALLASRHVSNRVREYMICFLVLETVMIGTFAALDVVLFYVFFESVLIPMFIIIGIWGGARRVYASYKFFLYTLLGSILMLLALIIMCVKMQTTDIPTLLAHHDFPKGLQMWLWLALLASFAVKLPMWPVHTWLPDAHVEAPTAGSIILAGVLLKMGGYGLLRFSLPMLPDASAAFAPLMWTLSLVAIVYTSLVALAQDDMKKTIAYSSVAHMGFVTLGLFAFNIHGLQAAMFQMISHGVVSGALFLCVGVLYDRMHTREIAAYGGVTNVMPRFAVFFMIMTMAAVGLPGTSGFVGEFLSLLAIFHASTSALPDNAACEGFFAWSQTVAVIAATGVVLGAAYMLWLYRRVMYGEVANSHVAELKDLDRVEIFSLVVLAAVVLWLGVNATALTDFLKPALDHTLSLINDRGACQALLPQSIG